MEYPKMFDQLPRGTVIWNAKQSPFNYTLAGKNLSNKVIYKDWENLAAALKFIEEHKIEYVVDTYPLCCKALEKKGARVVLDEQVSSSHRWRVWRIRPGSSSTKVSKSSARK